MRRIPTLTLSILSILALGLGLSACSSSDKKSGDDLDVTMEDGGPGPAITDGGKALPATAVTNWQGFFKAPPSQKERSLLEQRLSTWQDKETAENLVAKGRTELALGRLAAAETSLRKALRLKDDSAEAQLELAALYLRKRDMAMAFELLSQVKDSIATNEAVGQPFVFRYRYTLALAYIARGDRDKGHKVLSDLIGIDKTFAPAYTSLASSYLDLGKDSVAEFVVRRGLDRVKDHAGLQNLMGVISRKSRQLDAARTWFDKALVADPHFAPALVNRAMLSATNLEYGAAEEDLLTALVQDPQNSDALVCLGIVQRRQGNFTGAKASLSKAVDVDPDNAFARFNLGMLLSEDLKRPNEALRLFHEVTQTSRASAELKEQAKSLIQDLKQSGESY